MNKKQSTEICVLRSQSLISSALWLFFVSGCIFVTQSSFLKDMEFKKISLEEAREYIVPQHKSWRLDGYKAYNLPDGELTTADILFNDARVYVGRKKEMYITGDFDFTLSENVNWPIYIMPGTKIQLGNNRKINITEINDR